MSRLRWLGPGALLATLAWAVAPLGLKAGDALPDVALRTADDTPATLPEYGARALVVFYTDADVPEMNDPLADALEASKIDGTLYEAFGVVNLHDSKAPNALIRAALRDKSEHYDSTILTDPELALAKAWNLGDCNNTSVVIVVGRDKKARYVYRGPVRGAEIEKVVALVRSLTLDAAAALALDGGAARDAGTALDAGGPVKRGE